MKKRVKNESSKRDGTSNKLATAPTIEGITRWVNEFYYSTGYVVDPETLAITHPNREPPRLTRVVRIKGGFQFESGSPEESP